MSTEHRSDVQPTDQIEAANQIQKVGTKELAPITTPAVSSWHIYILTAYYMVILVGAVALLMYLVFNEDLKSDEKPRLLVSIGFLTSGAVIGSILYQIRMLFKYYVKNGGFDTRWLSKYYTAPAESVGLALAVMSLIQSGGMILGGQHFNLAEGKPFAAFGFGALVGFGIREVVGWVGNLTKTMFSARPE